jgi:hypothetical protein
VIENRERVILSGASRGFIARGAVEGSAVNFSSVNIFSGILFLFGMSLLKAHLLYVDTA